MVKTLKNLLLQNQERFEAETWYIALETQGLPSLLKMTLSWPFTFSGQGQICSLCICSGKCWKIISQYVFKTNGLNFNVWSKLQTLLVTIKILSHGVICLCPWVYVYMYIIVSSLRSFLLWNSSTNFHQISHGAFCQFVQMVLYHWIRWPPCPYMVKHLKIFFSRTKKALRLSFDLFTARSNLRPQAFV